MIRGQTRKQSILEALVNVAIGYGFGVVSQEIIFPMFGIHVPFRDHLMISGAFTVASVIRQYTLRRAFNLWQLCKSS